MRIDENDPPREFRVGRDGWVKLSDCGSVFLEPDEGIVIESADGVYQWPVIRREWGFELPVPLNTPHGEAELRAVFSGKDWRNSHLLLFDPSRRKAFEEYEKTENHTHFIEPCR